MRVLFIGGTGFISAAVSRQAIAKGLDLYLLNRGVRDAAPPGSHSLTADTHRSEDVRAALAGLQFDVVVDWIAYTPADIERDMSLFKGRVEQYIFIGSAAAYQKPPAHYLITESTLLHNPFWDYARNKIACEERLLRAHREEGFPATVVRPSHTYETNFPVAIGGAVFDNSKIKKFVPEFEATTPFREGIRRTLEWFDVDERRRRVDEAAHEEMDHILSSYDSRLFG